MPIHAGSRFHDLPTPCLLVDIDILRRNIAGMADHAKAAGKSLRPHVKSHKCAAIARMQREAGAIGVSAATVPEVAGLVRAGVTGALLTSPAVSAPAVEELLDARERDPSLIAVVDGPDHARMLDRAASARGFVLDVLLDIDIGLNRTGVAPEDALDSALLIEGLPGLKLRGIQAYAGHVQHIVGWESRRERSLACMDIAAGVVRRLRDAGLPCDIFSGTGTGTHDIDIAVPELTELQTGSYVFMDAEYLAVGSRESEEFTAFRPALTLLATVLSTRHGGSAVIDAGLKALYRDGGTPRVVAPATSGMTYGWFGDEFGRLEAPGGTHLAPGDRVELVVSHCDPTVALFDRLYIRRGEEIVDVWEIDLRRG